MHACMHAQVYTGRDGASCCNMLLQVTCGVLRMVQWQLDLGQGQVKLGGGRHSGDYEDCSTAWRCFSPAWNDVCLFCFCFVVFTVFTLSAHTSNDTNIPTGRLFFFNANKGTMKHRNKQTDVIVHSLAPCWRLTSVVGGRPIATGNDELFVQWRSTISRVCCCTGGRAPAGPHNHLGHRSGLLYQWTGSSRAA